MLTRGMRVLVDEDLSTEDIRALVIDQILADLNILKYSWEIIEK